MGATALSIFIGAKYGMYVWLGPEFAQKSTVTAYILAIGILFNSMAQVPHAYIQASGDARSTALIHLLESIIYIPALLILLHFFGILGASLAWMLRALIDLIMMHYKAMKVH